MLYSYLSKKVIGKDHLICYLTKLKIVVYTMY